VVEAVRSATSGSKRQGTELLRPSQEWRQPRLMLHWCGCSKPGKRSNMRDQDAMNVLRPLKNRFAICQRIRRPRRRSCSMLSETCIRRSTLLVNQYTPVSGLGCRCPQEARMAADSEI